VGKKRRGGKKNGVRGEGKRIERVEEVGLWRGASVRSMRWALELTHTLGCQKVDTGAIYKALLRKV